MSDQPSPILTESPSPAAVAAAGTEPAPLPKDDSAPLAQLAPENGEEAPAEQVQEQDKSLLVEIITSITTPGVSSGIVKATNATFGALFLSLLFLLYASGADIHVIFLLAVALGLFLSIQWFLSVLAEVKAEEAAKEAAEKPAADSTPGSEAGVADVPASPLSNEVTAKKKKSQKLD